MFRYAGLLVCTALIFAGCQRSEPVEGAAPADDDDSEVAMSGEVVTVSGRLIDTKCYGMNHDNMEDEHTVPMADGSMGKMPGCATACAKTGIPVGLLRDGQRDADVYVLVTPAGGLSDHLAKEARVTGVSVFASSIIPEKIEIKGADGAWQEVSVGTMM